MKALLLLLLALPAHADIKPVQSHGLYTAVVDTAKLATDSVTAAKILSDGASLNKVSGQKLEISSDDVIPTADATSPLGSASRRFLGVYTTKVFTADGTQAAPAIAPINDSNSGIYAEGADHLGIVAGGVSQASATVSGLWARTITTTTQSPASNAACTAGMITWDASYIYVCTASGAWKRSALTGGY